MSQLVVFPSGYSQLQLNNLRSLGYFEYGIQREFISELQQIALLRIILSSTPQLVQLRTEWTLIMKTKSVFDEENCPQLILTNLRELHLRHYDGSRKETFSLIIR